VDAPTKKDTEIAAPLFQITRSNCLTSHCRIYFFTDLIDSKPRVLIQKNVSIDAANNEGRSRGQGLLRASDPLKPKFDVFVWGFGRNEANKPPLKQNEMEILRAYWKAFFTEIGASSSSIAGQVSELMQIDPPVVGSACSAPSALTR